MAQKSLKTLAARNTTTLNRTHLITLAIHTLYHISRLLLSRPSRRPSFFYYILLCSPALAIEAYFEYVSRPSKTETGDLKRAGEDLEAKGLTEWMWDILYWTWICIVAVAVFGDRAWWLWLVVPGYSVYLAVTTYTGMRSGLGGLMGGGDDAGGGTGSGGQSKRQAKMEKRGGQKMVYR